MLPTHKQRTPKTKNHTKIIITTTTTTTTATITNKAKFEKLKEKQNKEKCLVKFQRGILNIQILVPNNCAKNMIFHKYTGVVV